MCLLDLTGYVILQLVVIVIKLIKPFYYCVCSACSPYVHDKDKLLSSLTK